MTIHVQLSRKSKFIPIGNNLYRKERSLFINDSLYSDAQSCLSLLVSWYWRCLDKQDVILNGMPEWECNLLHQLGVLNSNRNFGIQKVNQDALPLLVKVADEISLALYGEEVRGCMSVGPNGRRFFMDRQPS